MGARSAIGFDSLKMAGIYYGRRASPWGRTQRSLLFLSWRHPAGSIPNESSGDGMPEKSFPVTRDGMQRLQRELHELRTVKRREIADRIHAAREFSTTQNNAEYDDAKNELEIVEGRIRTLEQQVQLAVLIDEERAHQASSVQIGSTVVVKQDSKEREFTIVGPTEADPPNGRISNESPVGKALLGKRVGDDVQVMAPRGVMRLTVMGIK